jgi:hypothetical protein
LPQDLEGKLSILDGQHRVGMMTILEQKDNMDALNLDCILVEVYPQQEHHDDSHAQDIFLEVNKAEPVKLVDMPGVAKGSDRKVITLGASRLQERFPNMFRPSQNCLFASNVIQRHNIKSAKALEDWMLVQNELLAEKYKSEDEQKKVAKTAMKKSIDFGFYLGLELSWLYQ